MQLPAARELRPPALAGAVCLCKGFAANPYRRSPRGSTVVVSIEVIVLGGHSSTRNLQEDIPQGDGFYKKGHYILLQLLAPSKFHERRDYACFMREAIFRRPHLKIKDENLSQQPQKNINAIYLLSTNTSRTGSGLNRQEELYVEKEYTRQDCHWPPLRGSRSGCLFVCASEHVTQHLARPNSNSMNKVQVSLSCWKFPLLGPLAAPCPAQTPFPGTKFRVDQQVIVQGLLQPHPQDTLAGA
uniref:Uncharacterized protein n=1 Tax=Coccidioides posadasii RMSCC 3488 TaxID=454284 RepID=A0A0J6FCJ0_COCPO|nr:hypothetical protein CPAG_04320 [Coccidioides posadasii RMSCC 3488]